MRSEIRNAIASQDSFTKNKVLITLRLVFVKKTEVRKIRNLRSILNQKYMICIKLTVRNIVLKLGQFPKENWNEKYVIAINFEVIKILIISLTKHEATNAVINLYQIFLLNKFPRGNL